MFKTLKQQSGVLNTTFVSEDALELEIILIHDACFTLVSNTRFISYLCVSRPLLFFRRKTGRIYINES
jgi:hypothetical protein